MSDLLPTDGLVKPKRSYTRRSKSNTSKVSSDLTAVSMPDETKNSNLEIVTSDEIPTDAAGLFISADQPNSCSVIEKSNQHTNENESIDVDLKNQRTNKNLEAAEMIQKTESWNQRHDIFFRIRTLFKQQDKFYFLIERNTLNPDLQDAFEDGRVEGAVMRGEKIPSIDEHWIKIRKHELRRLQDLFGNSAWFSDQLPQRKLPLVWGSLPAKKVGPDKDSQEYHLAKWEKSNKKANAAYKSSEYYNPFLTF